MFLGFWANGKNDFFCHFCCFCRAKSFCSAKSFCRFCSAKIFCRSQAKNFCRFCRSPAKTFCRFCRSPAKTFLPFYFKTLYTKITVITKLLVQYSRTIYYLAAFSRAFPRIFFRPKFFFDQNFFSTKIVFRPKFFLAKNCNQSRDFLDRFRLACASDSTDFVSRCTRNRFSM